MAPSLFTHFVVSLLHNEKPTIVYSWVPPTSRSVIPLPARLLEFTWPEPREMVYNTPFFNFSLATADGAVFHIHVHSVPLPRSDTASPSLLRITIVSRVFSVDLFNDFGSYVAGLVVKPTVLVSSSAYMKLAKTALEAGLPPPSDVPALPSLLNYLDGPLPDAPEPVQLEDGSTLANPLPEVIHEHILAPLFGFITQAADLYRLLRALLLEQRVLVVSSQVAKLCQAVHACLAAISPFQWRGSVLSVAPPQLTGSLYHTEPCVVGILSCYMQSIPTALLRQLCVFYADTGHVVLGDTLTIPPLPANVTTLITKNVEPFLGRTLDPADASQASDSMLGAVAHLLSNALPSSAWTGQLTPEAVLSGQPPQAQEFLGEFTKTSIFVAYQNALLNRTLSPSHCEAAWFTPDDVASVPSGPRESLSEPSGVHVAIPITIEKYEAMMRGEQYFFTRDSDVSSSTALADIARVRSDLPWSLVTAGFQRVHSLLSPFHPEKRQSISA